MALLLLSHRGPTGPHAALRGRYGVGIVLHKGNAVIVDCVELNRFRVAHHNTRIVVGGGNVCGWVVVVVQQKTSRSGRWNRRVGAISGGGKATLHAKNFCAIKQIMSSGTMLFCRRENKNVGKGGKQ